MGISPSCSKSPFGRTNSTGNSSSGDASERTISTGPEQQFILSGDSKQDWKFVKHYHLGLEQDLFHRWDPTIDTEDEQVGSPSARNNMLRGEILSWLFNIKALRYLFLGRNKLAWNNNVKIVPKCMLSRLSLLLCGLAGEIPEWISTQKTPDFLDLSENNLERNFTDWLAEMEVGSTILSDNKFSGSLPIRLFQSLSLSFLALSRNNFSGELPENIGDANEIMILMLAGNTYSWPIPVPVPIFTAGYCWTSQEIDFLATHSRFSALMPCSPFVDFSYNEFSGEIPVTFSQETQILAL
ncbi:hypothetical protein Acr_28g0015140 [Actinidia rufa]|uniref:Uncharacterized protein n=1 Tax=Actinidia rufa TaxID=165716 RepID=A0A7J0HCM2_9ERIC|nr:hypothetical protein Acr_28g0015140 [Actinidia rufa]